MDTPIQPKPDRPSNAHKPRIRIPTDRTRHVYRVVYQGQTRGLFTRLSEAFVRASSLANEQGNIA
jgi:capsid protein